MSPRDLPAPSTPVARPGRLRRAPRLGGALVLALLALPLSSCDTPALTCEEAPNGPNCNFSLDVSLSQIFYTSGQDVSVLVSVTRPAGYNRDIRLSVRPPIPDGFSFQFESEWLEPGDVPTSYLEITGDPAPGTYTVTVESTVGPDHSTRVIEDALEIIVLGGVEECAPWAEVESHRAPYTSVHFIPYSTTGYVTADNNRTPTLLKSTDGGRTWAPAPSTPTLPDDAGLRGVFFLQELSPAFGTGYLAAYASEGAGYEGRLFRTRNNAASWEPLPAYEGGLVSDMYFISDNTGIVLSRDYQTYEESVWRTDDGGDTWTHPSIPPIGDYRGVDGSGAAWVIAGSTDFAYSADYGVTWQRASGARGNSYWVSFFDDNNALAGGSGILARTNTGGTSWVAPGTTTVPVTYDGSAQRSPSGGSTLAYAVGPEIWETRDAGITWQRVCNHELDEVATLSNGAAVAVRNGIWRRD
jgi:photosystem II stability/assembly factor-like uncharacterized protein